MQPCITKPTGIVNYNRASLVDNIFVNINDKEIHSGNITDKITDHLPNFVIIKNMRNKLQKQKFKIRNMKTFDKAEYLNDIKELDNLNLYQYRDLDKMYDVYQNNLIEIIDRNAPYNPFKKTVKAKAETLDNFKYFKIYQNKKFVLQKIPHKTKKVLV